MVVMMTWRFLVGWDVGWDCGSMNLRPEPLRHYRPNTTGPSLADRKSTLSATPIACEMDRSVDAELGAPRGVEIGRRRSPLEVGFEAVVGKVDRAHAGQK